MTIDIDEIEVGERRREDYGDVAGLAASIQKYGLIHPVVIDADRRLLAGGRRLEAARILGWEKIDCRDFGELTEQERWQIELEENLRRKDLTAYEQARDLVRKAVEIAPLLQNSCTKKPRGEPRVHEVPREDIAKAIGSNRETIREAEQHVATAEAYPFMQKPEWKQYHVLEARESLAKLPEEDREAVAALVDQPGIPPKKALEIVKNLTAMPEEDRARVYALAASEDPRDKSLALTEAIKLPPRPDPRLSALDVILQDLRGPIKAFDDEATIMLRDAYNLIALAIKAIEKLDKERNNGTAGF